VDHVSKSNEEYAVIKAMKKYKSIYKVSQSQNDTLNLLFDQITQNY